MSKKILRPGRKRSQLGQAMVETVIVLPVFIFFLLGMIQMTMMHQARLMLEYAAFNAARVGSVWNADPFKMRQAALLSLISTRPSWPVIGGVGKIEDYGDLILAAGKLTAANAINSALGEADLSSGLLSLVKVDVLSPTQADFGSDQEEIDFDQGGDKFEVRRLGQLTIRVTYFYSLVIPFANWVIWNTWYMARSVGFGQAADLNNTMNQLGMDLGLASRPFIAFDAVNITNQGKILGELMGGGDFKTSPYECLRKADWLTMAFLPNLLKDDANIYYIPLVTAHTIRMQSNHYKNNLPTAEEAACSD